MTVTMGQKVYYAGRGPYLVADLVSKVVCGASAKFYKFVLLDESGEELLVPVASASLLPLRPLTAFNKIPELLGRLKNRSGPPREMGNWREREEIRAKVFASGSAFELGDFLESMTRSSNVRRLGADEFEAMRRARKLLTAEIAAVMGESLSITGSRIEDVLNPEQTVIAKSVNKRLTLGRAQNRR